MKKPVSILLLFSLILSCGLCCTAGAEEPEEEPVKASFEELGLADRVLTIGEAAEQEYAYHYYSESMGRELLSYVSPMWAYISGYNESAPAIYVPEGAPSGYTYDGRTIMQYLNSQLEDPEAYEWRGIMVRLDTRGDENFGFSLCLEDYYNSDLWDESKAHFSYDGWDYWTNTILFEGREMTVYSFGLVTFNSEDMTVRLSNYCCVPKGYDGIVDVCYSKLCPAITFPEGMHFYDYIDDNALFFRVSE